jgi:hypothetical protein
MTKTRFDGVKGIWIKSCKAIMWGAGPLIITLTIPNYHHMHTLYIKSIVLLRHTTYRRRTDVTPPQSYVLTAALRITLGPPGS